MAYVYFKLDLKKTFIGLNLYTLGGLNYYVLTFKLIILYNAIV